MFIWMSRPVWLDRKDALSTPHQICFPYYEWVIIRQCYCLLAQYMLVCSWQMLRICFCRSVHEGLDRTRIAWRPLVLSTTIFWSICFQCIHYKYRQHMFLNLYRVRRTNVYGDPLQPLQCISHWVQQVALAMPATAITRQLLVLKHLLGNQNGCDLRVTSGRIAHCHSSAIAMQVLWSWQHHCQWQCKLQYCIPHAAGEGALQCLSQS